MICTMYITNPNCKFLSMFFLVPVLCFNLDSTPKCNSKLLWVINCEINCVSRLESMYAAWFISCLTIYTLLSKHNCVQNCVNSYAGQSNFLCTMTWPINMTDSMYISGLAWCWHILHTWMTRYLEVPSMSFYPHFLETHFILIFILIYLDKIWIKSG